MKIQLRCQLGDRVLQKAVYTSSQCMTDGMVSPLATTHESGVGAEVGTVLFTLIPNDPPEKCLLLVLLILNPAGPKSLVPDGGDSCLEIQHHSIELEAETSSRSLWASNALKPAG